MQANLVCGYIYQEYVFGPRKFFLYAEVDDGISAPVMVQVYEDHVFWLTPPDRVFDCLMIMWDAVQDKPHWWALRLDIDDDTFRLVYDYDPASRYDEYTNERSMAAMKARFPDLPVRHPPFDPDTFARDAMLRLGRAASFELGPDAVRQFRPQD